MRVANLVRAVMTKKATSNASVVITFVRLYQRKLLWISPAGVCYSATDCRLHTVEGGSKSRRVTRHNSESVNGRRSQMNLLASSVVLSNLGNL